MTKSPSALDRKNLKVLSMMLCTCIQKPVLLLLKHTSNKSTKDEQKQQLKKKCKTYLSE